MQKRSLETRTRILNTSLELFSTIGYEKTGVALICQKGAVSKGSFYHHFPSKHSVFIALIERWLADIDARFVKDVAQASDVPSGILAMTDTFAELTRSRPVTCRSFLNFGCSQCVTPKFGSKPQRLIKTMSIDSSSYLKRASPKDRSAVSSQKRHPIL